MRPNKLTISIVVLIVVVIVVMAVSCQKDGSPGKWATPQIRQLQTVYRIDPYKTPIFTYVAETLTRCGVMYLTRKYHYKILLNPKQPLKENEHKKLNDRCFGTREEWNRDFYFYCENQLSKNLPRACASCIMQNISRLISPHGFMTLARQRNTGGDDGLGATASLAMVIQMALKNCPECANS